jgi:hypothetical protein
VAVWAERDCIEIGPKTEAADGLEKSGEWGIHPGADASGITYARVTSGTGTGDRLMRFRCCFSVGLALLTSLASHGHAGVSIDSSHRQGPDWLDDSLGNDAGNTLGTGQRVRGEGGQVLHITGTLGGGTGLTLGGAGGDHQDVFLIYIADPEAFSASTRPPDGYAEFNSRLWLFRIDSRGLLAADDVSDVESATVLHGQSSNGQTVIDRPGVYGLAITGTPVVARTVGSGPMFPPPGLGETVGPNSDGAANPILHWAPFQGDGGDYRIAVTGVRLIRPTCGDGGDCLMAHDSPGCADLDCCVRVCENDPLCCEDVWDDQCASVAREICGGCGDTTAGDCMTPHDGPYCDEPACCDAVCLVDPTCCTSDWDVNCVKIAGKTCDASCNRDCPGDFDHDGDRDGDDLAMLFANWGAGGCTDLDGNGRTNGHDVGLLLRRLGGCTDCGRIDAEACFAAHSSPGCDDESCCSQVCAIDPACCLDGWDVHCADAALLLCTEGCGDPAAGSCHQPHTNPGCDDAECCYAVCEYLPRCCQDMWDGLCTQIAGSLPPCQGQD